MPTDWRHDDREQVKRARNAVEALFKPRQQVGGAEAPAAAPRTPSLSAQQASSEQPAPRTPGVIAIPAMTPVRDQKVETPAIVKPAMVKPAMKEPAMVGPKPPKPRRVVADKRPKIPASEFPRIRTLAEYGMTLEQLAENYGVSADEIERIVGLAGNDGAVAQATG